MLLIRKLLTSHLIISKLICQDLHILSSFLCAWLVIAATVEKSRAFDRLHEADFLSAVKVFNVEGRVDCCDCFDVAVVCGNAEGSPHSPTKGSS